MRLNTFTPISYRLLIQPLDYQYDFLEEIGRKSMEIYYPRIRGFKVLSMKFLPEHVLIKPQSLLAKFIMGDKSMIHLSDLYKLIEADWKHNLEEISLFILPHSIIGLGYDVTGFYLGCNLSIVSTYSFKEKHLRQSCIGVSLHEIGHTLGLKHCKINNCLMKTPCKPKNFHKGIYRLCEEHKNQVLMFN
ncbi:MAG: matrixin family metalloprotease [Candidatus Bathyarchaeia archaeon]